MWLHKSIRLGMHITKTTTKIALIQQGKYISTLKLFDCASVKTSYIEQAIRPYTKRITATAGVSDGYLKHDMTLPKKLSRRSIRKYITHHFKKIFNTSLENVFFSFTYHHANDSTVISLFAINKTYSNQLQHQLQSAQIKTTALEPIEYSLHRIFPMLNNLHSGSIVLISDTTTTVTSNRNHYLCSSIGNKPNIDIAQTTPKPDNNDIVRHTTSPDTTLIATPHKLKKLNIINELESRNDILTYHSLRSLGLKLGATAVDDLSYLPAICLALGN